MGYFQKLGMLALTVCLVPFQAMASPDASSASAAHKPQLTILFDAFGREQKLKKDWGYSAFVEVAGKRILFDTGNDAAIFEHNVKAKGIDLRSIDFVVLSHRHSDHMGGLAYLLSVNPKVKIYAPKENFGVYGSSLPSSFYRKAETLPPEMRYYDGSPPDTLKFGTAWPKANFELIDKTTEISPGITLIALVSDKPGTLELKELSLAIDTPEGVVLVVGCSHTGIDRIVEAAIAINKRIHLIAGGMHLAAAPDSEIERLVATLHDVYRVEWVAPGHCTGEPAFAALLRTFGEHDLYAGLGSTVGLGSNPRAELNGQVRQTMNDDDMRDYTRSLRQRLISFGRPKRTGNSAIAVAAP